MFAQLYKCFNCGPVWKVETYEDIDCDNDRIEEIAICQKCGSPVTPIYEEGKPVVHILSEEEMEFEMSWPNEEEDYFDGPDYE